MKQVHSQATPSLLSSDATNVDFRGLFNLGGITLIVMNIRLVVENMMKYGVLLTWPTFNIHDWPRTWPCLTGALFISFVFPFIAWLIEYVGLNTRILHSINIMVEFIVPIMIVKRTRANVFPGLCLTVCGIVIFLKLISYAHVSNEARNNNNNNAPETTTDNNNDDNDDDDENKSALRKRKHQQQSPKKQSNNNDGDDEDDKNKQAKSASRPSLMKLVYFMVAPTLIYQEEYPRNKRIRKRFIMRRMIELLFLCFIILILAEQYMLPTVKNAVKIMDRYENEPMKMMIHLFERVLKLAVPNGCLWLLGFYAFFHSYLNLVAEILKFADRKFYLDFWNAPSVLVYWRTWNLPVHNFLTKHIYIPAKQMGLSRTSAMLVVFVFSAILHEVLISVPTHLGHLWAFLAMISQIPLIILTSNLRKPYGNIAMWVCFLALGQPLAVILYYTAYVRELERRQ